MVEFVRFVSAFFGQLRAGHIKHALSFVSLVVFIGGMILGCGNGGEDAERTTQRSLSDQMESVGSQETPHSDDSALSPQVVAVVNEEEIMAAELADRLHRAIREGDVASPPDEYTLNRLRETALTELIEKRLIAQKAKEQNISVSEEEFQQLVQHIQNEYGGADIRNILAEQGKSYDVWASAQQKALLLEKLVDTNMASMIAVTPEEVRQYYEKNKEKYDHPAQIRASQILTYDQSVAQKAHQEIQSGMDFGKVAEKYSESADAKDGGDLGFFARGVMPPEFDSVIFSLKMGEVSDIVKTPYGYQIFKLTGQREAHRISFEEAKEQIENLLKKRKRMIAVDLWLVELRDNAKILLNHDVVKRVN